MGGPGAPRPVATLMFHMSRKKSAVRSTRFTSTKSRRSRGSRRSPGNFTRFLKAFSTSAIAAFVAASFVLQPQWRDGITLQPILAQLGWPQQQAVPVHVAGAYAQTRFARCPQFFPGERMPIVPAAPALRELCYDAFAILHSGETKTPVFVAQRLNRRLLMQARNVERTDRFYAEARLPRAERAVLDDYRGSGYSRGHLAPAGDMHNLRAMEQSFSLANMVPQDQSHNSGAWNRIEQDTRKYVMRARGDVHVFTGPVYGDSIRTIGRGAVAVPSYMFKLVHDAESGHTWVHWQANSPHASAGKPIGYAEFVRRTGLHLLPPSGS